MPAIIQYQKITMCCNAYVSVEWNQISRNQVMQRTVFHFRKQVFGWEMQWLMSQGSDALSLLLIQDKPSDSITKFIYWMSKLWSLKLGSSHTIKNCKLTRQVFGKLQHVDGIKTQLMTRSSSVLWITISYCSLLFMTVRQMILCK